MRDAAILDELRVLGLVLEDVRRFDDVLRHGDLLFGTKEGITLFEACKKCHEKRGRVIPEVVQGYLRRAVRPDEARYIVDTAIEASAFASWEESLRILADRAHRRRIVQAASSILQAANNEEMSAADLDAEAIRLITEAISGRELVDAVTIGEVAERLLDDLDSKKPLVKAIPAGLVSLNSRLKGLRSGCLYTVGAATGMGKTHLMMHIAYNASKQGHVGLIVSLEMDRYALRDRMLARFAGSYDLSRVIDADLRGKLEYAVSEVAGLPLYICDNRSIGVQHVQSLARVLEARHGLDYIIVDYLTLLNDPPGVREKRHAVGHNVKELRALAGELQVPMIVVSQVNRSLAHRDDKRPKISDLYESAVIEQHSDGILLLHREGKYIHDAHGEVPPEVDGVMEIEIAKLRYAPDGGKVYVRLDAGTSTLRDMERHEMQDYLIYLEAMRRGKKTPGSRDSQIA